ncbi:MAG: hypothetical protein V3T76_05915 [candidate division NC10 bacterium]
MGKRNWVLIGCLMLLGLAVGCGQAETPQPTAPAVPGWQKFEGRNVELWLPPTYQGGDLSGKNLEMVVEGIRTLGPDFEEVAQVIERNPSAFLIFAVDSEVGESGNLTNMNVVAERVPSAVTMNTYLDLVAKKLPRQYRVIEREIVQLDHHQAGRLVLEIEDVKQLMYAIKSDNTMWAVNYSTGVEEFEQRLPVFEQSARTFNVRPQPLWKKVVGILWAKFVRR